MEEMILFWSTVYMVVGLVLTILISIHLITDNKFTWGNILNVIGAGLCWPIVIYMAIKEFVEDDHNFPRP